ncbi:MAG: cytochrome c oxidase accessory protein CcoG [Pseudomonadales bacterium]
MTDEKLIPVQELALEEVGEIDLYQKREKIYTRKIEGLFQRLRLFTGWPLLLGYVLLPWLNFDNRQAILFDLPARQFHIFSLTFWPQDFHMLAWLLIIAAFCLFAVTNFAGRIWCGYTCPQTVWTSMFMWAEQVTEGSRNQRIKLDKQPFGLNKLYRKSLKHGIWLGIAFVTGFTFVGYFSPIEILISDFFIGEADTWAYLWTLFFTCATYINAAYLREQVCMHMCPYARFQSAMFDSDTLIVSYNATRGDPRGSRKKGADYQAEGKGDCIDCELCVQVCPTGIDIRDGLQYQCIGCALCIDACDSVMEKMDYPTGLVSYTTERELAGGKTQFLRPRLIGYVIVILVMCGLFSSVLFNRIPLRLDAERDRNRLYVETDMGLVENIYTLKIMNMSQELRDYRISSQGIENMVFIGPTEIVVNAGEVYTLPVRLQVDPGLLTDASTDITFTVTDTNDDSITQTQDSRFIGPLNR